MTRLPNGCYVIYIHAKMYRLLHCQCSCFRTDPESTARRMIVLVWKRCTATLLSTFAVSACIDNGLEERSGSDAHPLLQTLSECGPLRSLAGECQLLLQVTECLSAELIAPQGKAVQMAVIALNGQYHQVRAAVTGLDQFA